MRAPRFDKVVVAEVRINRTTRPHEVDVRGAFVNASRGTTYGWTMPMRALSPDAQRLFDEFVAVLEADFERAYYEGDESPARSQVGMRPPPDDAEPGGIGEFAGDGIPQG